jgi:hypothetical protein
MKRHFVVLLTALVAALVLAAPAPAGPARGTQECTSFGSLPPGPPPRVGVITVDPAGGHITPMPPLVPGPCSAPPSPFGP